MFSDGVIVTDGAGLVTFLNPVAEELTGWRAEEARGQALEAIFPPAGEALRSLRGGEAAWLLEETALAARAGRSFPVDGSASAVRGADGGLLGAALVFRDLTALKMAQEEHFDLASIVEFSEDAIVRQRLDGTVASWNEAAARIFGYAAAEMIGNKINVLIPPGRPDDSIEILERVRLGDCLRRREAVRRRKEGEEIVVELTDSPIRDAAGRIVGASQIARDVSGLKRMQEQVLRAQKLESMSVLAGGIAHDFNNLLMGIIANATLIQDEAAPDSPVEKLSENILASTEQAAHLTRQMLAYSGRGKYSIEPLNLASQIQAASALIKASIPKTVKLNLNLAPNLLPVEGDAGQIRQVVTNLALNAVEAIAGDGVVTIATSLRQIGEGTQPGNLAGSQLPPGCYAALEVRDNGSGMDEATRERMFDPFFTTRFTGRGLGLAAVLGIVRGHRGGIAVSSEPGKGTTFQVLLPVLNKPANVPAAGVGTSASV